MQEHEEVSRGAEQQTVSLLRFMLKVLGVPAIEEQLDGLIQVGTLRTGDTFTSVSLDARKGSPLPELGGNPVTATAADSDGLPLVVQVLMQGGRLSELAVFKADGSAILQLPDISNLRAVDTTHFEAGQARRLPTED